VDVPGQLCSDAAAKTGATVVSEAEGDARHRRCVRRGCWKPDAYICIHAKNPSSRDFRDARHDFHHDILVSGPFADHADELSSSAA
jgi:hypothetical protein